MKVIYTRENFLHINNDYPLNTFSVFFDDVQHDIKLNCDNDYINIPIYKYSYVSFEKQYAKFVAISNQRRKTELEQEYNDEYGFKKYKDVTFAEYTQGTPENLLILFPEKIDYLDQYLEIVKGSLKYNTKLIVIKDEFLQYGSNYIFKNNGEYLFSSIVSFIDEKSQYFEPSQVTLIGSRTGAKAAKIYGHFFPDFKVITFNNEYKNMSESHEIHALQTNGISFKESIEFTSYAYERLLPEQSKERNIVINSENYSFTEMIKLSFFFAQINNKYREKIVLDSIVLKFEYERFELPKEIISQPLIAFYRSRNIMQRVKTYSYGGNYYLIATEFFVNNLVGKIIVYTEDEIFELPCEVE